MAEEDMFTRRSAPPPPPPPHTNRLCFLLKDASGRVAYELAEDDDIRSLLGGPDGRLFAFAAAGAVDELRTLLDSGAVTSLKVWTDVCEAGSPCPALSRL
eukprot:36351-Chlamydomonas_euryale.AAC.1